MDARVIGQDVPMQAKGIYKGCYSKQNESGDQTTNGFQDGCKSDEISWHESSRRAEADKASPKVVTETATGICCECYLEAYFCGSKKDFSKKSRGKAACQGGKHDSNVVQGGHESLNAYQGEP